MSWCVRATAALTLTRSSAAVAADSAITDRSARTLTPGAVVRFDRLAAVFTGLPLAGYTILTVQIIQSSSLAAARPRWPRAAGLRDARAAPGRLSSTPIFSEPAAASCPPGSPSRRSTCRWRCRLAAASTPDNGSASAPSWSPQRAPGSRPEGVSNAKVYRTRAEYPRGRSARTGPSARSYSHGLKAEDLRTDSCGQSISPSARARLTASARL
jgi:hypothetical protein